MGLLGLSCNLISFHILFLLLFVQLSSSQLLDSGDPCANKDCGQGKCVNSTVIPGGFDCVCNPGWSKPQLGFIGFPACIIPNNSNDPCANKDCGQGKCVNSTASHVGFECVCNPGWSKPPLSIIGFPACTVPNNSDPCANKDCGQGKCVNSTASPGGFDCVCNSGWSKPLGLLGGLIGISACTFPNCAMNNQCGNGAPPPPPPPPVASPPPLDFLNPCNIVFCGDGTCVRDGLGYYCKCNEGSENFLNLTGVACLNECFLTSSDCHEVSLNPPASGNTLGPVGAPANPPALPKNVTSNVPNCSTTKCGHAMLLLICLILLTSFI